MAAHKNGRCVAIYVRVSSKKQDHRSQLPDLEKWVEAFADGREVKWYRDKQTGKTMDRPGWKRLEADVDSGKVSAVVCWRLDRLGRTAAGLTVLFEKLTRLKINLVSVRDSIDLSTASGRLIANVLASVASYENEVRSERIRAGIDAAKAAGKRWGGSKKGRQLRVTDDKIATVLRMARRGKSKVAMAETVGLSRSSIYTILAEHANGRNGSK